MSLNNLAKKIHDTAEAHGFWPEEGRNFGEMLALMHSELSEALEEHRQGHPPVWHKFVLTTETTPSPEAGAIIAKFREAHANRMNDGDDYWHPDQADIDTLVEEGIAKPEGTAVELVDALIRILDTLHSLDVDIDDIVRQKMSYNDSRKFKHGKAY